MFGGGPLAIVDEALNPAIPSILYTWYWYSGEEGGHALVGLLFGRVSPAGRLPVTFPLSDAQLPAVLQRVDARAARPHLPLHHRHTLYSFGYGLSYTTFIYHTLGGQGGILSVQRVRPGEQVTVEVRVGVTNAGAVKAAEVVQAYVSVLPFTFIPGQHSPSSLPRTQLSA